MLPEGSIPQTVPFRPAEMCASVPGASDPCSTARAELEYCPLGIQSPHVRAGAYGQLGQRPRNCLPILYQTIKVIDAAAVQAPDIAIGAAAMLVSAPGTDSKSFVIGLKRQISYRRIEAPHGAIEAYRDLRKLAGDFIPALCPRIEMIDLIPRRSSPRHRHRTLRLSGQVFRRSSPTHSCLRSSDRFRRPTFTPQMAPLDPTAICSECSRYPIPRVRVRIPTVYFAAGIHAPCCPIEPDRDLC